MIATWKGPGCLKKLGEGFIHPGGEIPAGAISEERLTQLVVEGKAVIEKDEPKGAPKDEPKDEPKGAPKDEPKGAGPKTSKKNGGSKK